MSDDKRLIREIKRNVKKTGNKKRRKHFKNVDTDPDTFDFGRNRSKDWNEKTKDNK